MKIKILMAGPLKIEYAINGLNYYAKKISHFVNFNLDLPKIKVNYTSKQEKLKKEASLLENHIPKTSYLIYLDIKGKVYKDSTDLANHLNNVFQKSSEIVFLIGGDQGLDEELKNKANETISISNLTFNHELAVLILSEMIYRSFAILKNHPYHK